MNKYLFEIKNELSNLQSKTDEELKIQIEKLKKRSKFEDLDDLISPWFAMVQEISYRTIGLKHFDTQLLAGLILHEGKSWK
jgi:preprotein translocase subunit SecA